MMKAGTETGSLMNHLMSTSPSPLPVVGMGATVLQWSDRQACTVVQVYSETHIVVQYDNAKRTDTNGMSDCQNYQYSPDPRGVRQEFVKTKNGWREKGSKGKGDGLLLGHRIHYHDYSF